MTFGEMVKAQRLAMSLSIGKAAKLAGIDYSSWSRAEHGHKTSLKTRVRIADALDLPLIDAIGQEYENPSRLSLKERKRLYLRIMFCRSRLSLSELSRLSGYSVNTVLDLHRKGRGSFFFLLGISRAIKSLL